MTALPFTAVPDLASAIRSAATAERDHRNTVEASQRGRRAGDRLDALTLAAQVGVEPGFVLGLLPDGPRP